MRLVVQSLPRTAQRVRLWLNSSRFSNMAETASLIWARQEDGSTRISLETSPATDIPTVSPPVVHSETVPGSVLQYERQLRKAQHAKKTGQAVVDLDLVYEDDSIMVVNKPPGVLTVPGIHSHASILQLVHARNNNNTTVSAEQMIVHRLDMDTAGIVVFGKATAVTKRLHTMFRDRHVEKEYQALLMGHLPVDHGVIDLALQRDHAHPPFMRVSTPASEAAAAVALVDLQTHGWKKLVRKQPKASQTEFYVVERGMREVGDGEELPFTRVRLQPITGRTHQLRVHCAALGFPILGDPTYGVFGEAHPAGGLDCVPSLLRHGPQENLVQACPLEVQKAWTRYYPPNVEPMCLHAGVLEFAHPETGKPLSLRVDPAF